MAHFLLNRCHTPDPWHASILSIDVTQFPYGGQLSTQGAPGLPNRLKSAAVPPPGTGLARNARGGFGDAAAGRRLGHALAAAPPQGATIPRPQRTGTASTDADELERLPP